MHEFRKVTDVLAEHVSLEGARVIDVGSGAGGLVRWMRRHGADPIGVECGEVMRARAHEADPDHVEAHIDGVGQDLPFEDETADVVVFSYSLHHVPGDEMVTALREAHRVLRPGGTLFVVEPEPHGPSFEVGKLVDDETVVRGLAQKALLEAPALGLELKVANNFMSEAVYEDFDAWEHHAVGIDPDRAAALETHRDEAVAAFEQWGTPVEGGLSFAQPNAFKVFERS